MENIKAFPTTSHSCNVISYLKARNHCAECLGCSLLCSPRLLLLYIPSHPSTPLSSLPSGSSLQEDLSTMTFGHWQRGGYLEVCKPLFNSLSTPRKDFFRGRRQTLFFKSFLPYLKLATGLGDRTSLWNTHVQATCPQGIVLTLHWEMGIQWFKWLFDLRL